MKKFITAILISGYLMSACTEDNSTLPSVDFPDIEIADFKEGGYTVVSYNGNRLELVADVKTAYDAADLTYTWYLIDVAKENAGQVGGTHETYEQEKISEGKTLSYEVNLPPGEYIIVCEVKASNDYTVTKETTLVTTTDFATGHYILKETADGNTDVDVYNETDKKLIENILTAALGEPMTGEPLMMSMAFMHSYINEQTNEMASTNMVSITTKGGDYKSLSTTDLSVLMDRNNVLFYEMDADEYPYAIQSGPYTNYLFSNKGVRTQFSASLGMPGSGKYGVTAGNGSSRFITFSSASWGITFWDENTRSIVACDYNGGYLEMDNVEMPTNQLTDYNCLACGTNELSETVYFLLENEKTGVRKLYFIDDTSMAPEMMEIRTLPEDSHLAQSTLFSTSVQSATYIYGLHDNVIYAYDMETGTEEALAPSGIPSGEEISYVSNQCLLPSDYLVIGTQKGDDYALYYYNQVGGKPDGSPVHVVKGKGKVKSMRYTKANLDINAVVPPYMD